MDSSYIHPDLLGTYSYIQMRISLPLPVLLSKNLMCLSSWAVIVTGSVGWLTTLLMWLFDCTPENKKKHKPILICLKEMAKAKMKIF